MPKALVTIRLDDTFDMEPVIARWEDNRSLLKAGSGALVYGLLDYVVDGHFGTIQEIDDEMERLEDVLFEDRPAGQFLQRSIYGLRKDLVLLRRIVLPMREIVNGILRHAPTSNGLDAWYDDLYDHVLRASEWTESLDTGPSISDQPVAAGRRLNTIMKKCRLGTITPFPPRSRAGRQNIRIRVSEPLMC